ncbi:MAG: hypothetical protein M3384_13680 [Acidobacteriota bacterium]|nr:hypothetical protein [Acidobacteriota bacterium]
MPNYGSDAGLLNHLQIQKSNIDQFAAAVGATAADITSIQEDFANLEWILGFVPLVDEYRNTAYGIKKKFVRGELNEPLGAFADAPDASSPSALKAGVEKRSRERDQRFLRSPTINEAARQALDLVSQPASVSPDSVKPTLQSFAAAGGYEFGLVIANRGDSDMYDVQARRKGSEVWKVVKSATGKTVNVTIEPTAPGQPEQLQVRVQLKRKNENYGQPSDPVYVTVNP